MAGLRDASTLLVPAVAETIRALATKPEDIAAAKLAGQYAAAIDAAPVEDRADVLKSLGPALLACLTALGATPAARAAVTKGQTAPPTGPNPLEMFRGGLA